MRAKSDLVRNYQKFNVSAFNSFLSWDQTFHNFIMTWTRCCQDKKKKKKEKVQKDVILNHS